MSFEASNGNIDPYSDAYNAPASQEAPAATEAVATRARSRSRSRSPDRDDKDKDRDRSYRRSPPPKRSTHAPIQANPSATLGVFGLSIRTQELDLDEEFGRFGTVDKVTIVYDQRSDRSRGFGFIKMGSVEDATRCIQELNGVELNGRRIRVDFSVTDRPHAPTPGEYMGHRKSRDSYRDRDRDSGRDRGDRRDRYRDDRDSYGRDTRDWRDRDRDRDRRSPPRRRRSRTRSRSRSPKREKDSSPSRW